MPDTPDVDALGGTVARSRLDYFMERWNTGALAWREADEFVFLLQAALDAANARVEEAEAMCELWRKRAIHLAYSAADASNPTHFTTMDRLRESAATHLASAMYSLDDGTLFLYPDNALAAAREAVRDA